jgi:hypothetical protein
MTPHTLDEAEQQLRAAIDAGDPTLITAAEAHVDRLANPTPAAPLLASALWYAEQGIPVFPLQPGRKVPFAGSHGLHDATADPTRITSWWTATPAANIGLATGHRFDVVDIDGPLGQKSRAANWDTIFAAIDADQLGKVLTPRPGGMHIYVPATGDGNSAGIVPGVDYRGLGGYVLAPPSVIVAGGKDSPGHYRFLGRPALAAQTGAGAA